MRSSKSCTRWETPAGDHEVITSCDQKGQITGMKHCLDGQERTKESRFEQSRQHPHASQVKRQIKRTRIVKADGRKAPKKFHSSSWAKDQGLFIRVIQILVKNLGHSEHVHTLLLEYSTHRIVTADLATITRILQFIFSDILPNLFNCLRT